MELGRPMPLKALSMATVASESETLGGRLKETVVAANWLWWLTDKGVLVALQWAKADRGVGSPAGVCR